MTAEKDDSQYDYDAFVAYDYNDYSWIRHSLLVEMEQGRGFKLCIHHRDFPAGEILEEIIVDRIQKSRKTILVLTSEFVRSQWCDFEVSMARSQMFQSGRDIIIAVILRPLPFNCINKTLHNILKTKLYLEWEPRDEHAKELFWAKLDDALTEVV
ncbi:hypothetical protein CAPTEDRAFT_145791 [Capitella teleta]|uniref:TIR domain-containing protein n=1 Tax=Capitella teleta TaxID=283909 RepID=X1Z4D5_CAPTE|nr:hypothetical protein CAPTEDRAFT_145791 [Capitella teleta]|eukprot:ELU00360.1 hypothetical protein CAPTEDRAFT_145791 [Capitella teleta]